MSLIKAAQGIQIAITDDTVFRIFEGGMDGGDKSCGGHVRKAFVIQQVGDHFPDRELARPDSGAYGLTAEGCLSAPRVVGRKRLLIDGLKHGDGRFGFVA